MATYDQARWIAGLFRHWQVSDELGAQLLGLPHASTVTGFCTHGAAPPEGDNTVERTMLLLRIHGCLRLLYSESPELCYGWVSIKNRMFNDRSPLEVMRDEGVAGIRRIATHLYAQLCE